jgi:hypothetical protein
MMRTATSALVIAVAVVAAARSQAQDERSFALTVAWADGRSTVTPLRPTFRFWTPYFGRTPSTDPKVRAIDIAGVREGDDALVTVSVMIGGTQIATRVPVTNVRVSPDSPVAIADMAKYGVAPFRIALVAVERTPVLTIPRVVSPSGQLEVDAHQVAGRLAYHVTVTNRGHAPLRAFRYQTMRQGHEGGSGIKAHLRDEPLVMTGSTVAFDTSVSALNAEDAASGIWNDWEVFEVTSVIWDDGLLEGDPHLQALERGLYREKHLLMPKVQRWLADACQQSFLTARRSLDAFSPPDRQSLLWTAAFEDLKEFAGTHSDSDIEAFHRWAADMLRTYTNWDARLVKLLSEQ